MLYQIRIQYDDGLFHDGNLRIKKSTQHELSLARHKLSQELLASMCHVPTHYIRLKPVEGSDDGYDGDMIVEWFSDPVRIK